MEYVYTTRVLLGFQTRKVQPSGTAQYDAVRCSVTVALWLSIGRLDTETALLYVLISSGLFSHADHFPRFVRDSRLMIFLLFSRGPCMRHNYLRGPRLVSEFV